MPIYTVQPNIDGLDVLSKFMCDRAHHFRRHDGLGDRSIPMIGPAFSVYSLSDALTRSPLKSARLTGWKYPVFYGENVLLAVMVLGTDGLEFGGMVWGGLANRFVEAARFAELALKKTRSGFEMRIFECPQLGIGAIWLAGDRSNRYVEFVQNNLIEGGPLKLETSVWKLIGQRIDDLAV